jgi:hypothetical protein
LPLKTFRERQFIVHIFFRGASKAKRLILEAWDRWIQKQALDADQVTGRASLKFFIELQDSNSSFLNFQTRGETSGSRSMTGW